MPSLRKLPLRSSQRIAVGEHQFLFRHVRQPNYSAYDIPPLFRCPRAFTSSHLCSSHSVTKLGSLAGFGIAFRLVSVTAMLFLARRTCSLLHVMISLNYVLDNTPFGAWWYCWLYLWLVSMRYHGSRCYYTIYGLLSSLLSLLKSHFFTHRGFGLILPVGLQAGEWCFTLVIISLLSLC